MKKYLFFLKCYNLDLRIYIQDVNCHDWDFNTKQYPLILIKQSRANIFAVIIFKLCIFHPIKCSFNFLNSLLLSKESINCFYEISLQSLSINIF
ncbi:unnamed protein product [Paramecium sonneborni]|uniref:Uncharacterized protein n=1 Tax=Paramecium sonneborni TaxID=65129 RepID=A0A8S1R7I9_9CILI|nr:unnamed protein product [Paramecium sonneborni]